MSRGTRFDWLSTQDHFRVRSMTRKRLAVPYSRSLRLEALEDRRLLAVVTVDTLDDTVNFGDGVTSLREAIFATNLVGGADTIQFSAALTADGPATILLTQGELAITDNLEINGTILLQLNGIALPLITIDASGNDPTPDVNNGDGSRVFNIDDGKNANLVNVSINGLKLSGGDVTGSGGAIRSLENLTVTDSTISGNLARGDGGGIYSRSHYYSLPNTLTVITSTVSGNSTVFAGGGIWGLIVTVTNSTISDNSADFGGGIAGSNATVTKSAISGNSATGGSGGGIWGSNVMVTDGTISGNSAGGVGGGIWSSNVTLTNSTISGNSAGLGGGGIESESGSVTLTNSTISGNSTTNGGGGGIASFDGNLTVTGGTISGNSAVFYGGGIHSLFSTVTVTNSTISDNSASGSGGGIHSRFGELTVTGSTISGNSATSDGGGIWINEASTIKSSTISGNVTGQNGNGNGGGIAVVAGGSLTVTDSAITGNSTRFNPSVSYQSGGGGIYNAGHLTVVRSTLTNNSTTREGGAIRSTGAGSVVVTDSTISGNTAGRQFISGEGGGIAVRAGGSLTVVGSTISDNTSNYLGGGISLLYGGTLTVTGSTISGNSAPQRGGGIRNDRGNVTVIGSTISGNHTGWGGGGILSYQGSLTVTDSTISGNSAILPDTGITSGGGINSSGGILTVTRSTISGNSAQQGGGISQGYGSATITDSTISGNFAVVTNHPSGPIGGYGGGLFTSHGSMTVTGSTISRNSGKFGGGISSGDRFTRNSTLTIADSTIDNNTVVDGHGGGIFHRAFSGDLTITGSTISGNTTNEHGGGLYLSAYDTPGTFTIRHSTIAANTALGQFGGGGIFVHSGTLALDHSIVATNVSLTGYGRDLSGLLSASIDARFSLIGDKSGSGLAEAPVGSPDSKGNLIGVYTELAPLADNGGLTKTHALSASSPARNAGDPSAVGGVGTVPQFDQRGAPYMRVFSGRIDIGAYERQSVQIPSLIVDTLVDETDGDYSPGDLSLREAIGLANGNVDSLQTITFAAALTAGGAATIHLSRGELGISDSLTIIGPGANLLTIDASASDPTPNQNNFDGSRVLNIDDGNFETDRTVSIFGLTLTGGDATFYGAGIFSFESLIVTDSTIRDNSASFGRGIDSRGKLTSIIGSTIRDNVGGGISAYSAELTVTDSAISGNGGPNVVGGGISGGGGIVTVTRSTVSGNSALQGGGIYVSQGTLTVTASTISGNSALFGGGIMSRGPITLTDSTVSGNRATYGYGGGILSLGYGQTTITNSTISGNFSNTLGGGIHFRSQLTVSHSTITGNRANTNGGGISNSGYGSAQLNHTIVAGNTRGATTRSDIFGSANLAFSLLGVNTGASIGDIGGNLIGTPSAPINAQLGLLAENGGPTMPDGSIMLTRALLPGSPAINAGDPSAVADVGGVPQFDQRGRPWTRVSGGRIDIGAFESQLLPPAAFGDYNGDGVVGTSDYTVWRNTLDSTSDLRADGNADGVVNSIDYEIWKSNFGMTLPQAVAGSGAAAITFSESVAKVGEPFAQDPTTLTAVPHNAKADANVAGFAPLDLHSVSRHLNTRLPARFNAFGAANSIGDNLLLVLAMDRLGHWSQHDSSVIDDHRDVEPHVADCDSRCLTDAPLEVALAEWP